MIYPKEEQEVSTDIQSGDQVRIVEPVDEYYHQIGTVTLVLKINNHVFINVTFSNGEELAYGLNEVEKIS